MLDHIVREEHTADSSSQENPEIVIIHDDESARRKSCIIWAPASQFT